MTDAPRFTINRKLVVLLPREPFVQWINDTFPETAPMTLEAVREDVDAFLLHEDAVEVVEDAQRWIEKRWRLFFEQMLFDWCTDEERWPKKPTLALFRAWVEVQFHSMIWDLSRAPVEWEDWHDEPGADDQFH